MQSTEFVIETERSVTQLEEILSALEPWRVNVKFSNGFETAQLHTIKPWNTHPLQKLRMFVEDLGEETFRRVRILDVGTNAGYNAITLAKEYDAQVVGIDLDRRNLAKADTLARLAGVSAEFKLEYAQDFRAAPFDVVLHLGTLYHMDPPRKALRQAALNTKPGGHLLLETVGYEGRDPLDARCIFGMGGDISNTWALGIGILEIWLDDAGFEEVRVLRRIVPKAYEGTGLCRLLVHARCRKDDAAIAGSGAAHPIRSATP